MILQRATKTEILTRHFPLNPQLRAVHKRKKCLYAVFILASMV